MLAREGSSFGDGYIELACKQIKLRAQYTNQILDEFFHSNQKLQTLGRAVHLPNAASAAIARVELRMPDEMFGIPEEPS